MVLGTWSLLLPLPVMIPCKRLFEYILFYKDEMMFQIEQGTKQWSKVTLTDPWAF
ncbi:unnamed protein product [Nyctereutes procyonoides]|uniref:(raccoon dog) hypothetical protein n=1 Tax=Nyctereutes procyonoides TaxID=34880 RepID=A0A811YWL6_NYCPR|nr:unnamed protein product [Nyctereutes procyonoides]